jgi:hypothetical protein
MLLELLSEDGKPHGKCFAKRCKDCNFFRVWECEDEKKKKLQVRKCSWEAILFVLPDIVGSIDGCQEASNNTRNVVLDFGAATIKTLESVAASPVLLNHTVKEME